MSGERSPQKIEVPKEVQARIDSIAVEFASAARGGEIARLFRRLLDATDNTITVTDPRLPDNPLVFVNEGFEDLTGYAADEVLGKNCRFLQEGDTDQAGVYELRAAIRDYRNAHVELRNYRKDGTLFWNELYLTAIRDDEGKPIYFFGVQNDITTLKELIATEQRRTTELALAEHRERRRLAQLLHDGLQQDLYALQFSLRRLGRARSAQNEFDAVLAVMDEQIKEASRTLRTVTTNLDTPVLEGEDLVPALAWLVERTQERHGLTVELEAQGDLSVLRAAHKMLLVAVARELVFNVVKHANAERVHLSVARGDGDITLTVKDDGAGFNPDALNSQDAAGTGFGLNGLRERVELFGGRLDIDAQPGAGTRVSVVLPNEN